MCDTLPVRSTGLINRKTARDEARSLIGAINTKGTAVMIDDKVCAAVCLCTLFFGAIFGFITGAGIERENYRAAAIKHGAAEYHPQTGHFRWKGDGE